MASDLRAAFKTQSTSSTVIPIGFRSKRAFRPRRWNEALVKVASLEEELQALVVEDPVSVEERQALLALGQDLAGVWDNPATSPAVKKRIARTLVKEIVLFDEAGSIKAVVHWQGGEHTEVRVPRLTIEKAPRLRPQIR